MMTWLSRNWGIKLVSLILAIGLWYYAVGEEGIEVPRVVPLEIKVLNPQMSILKASNKVVQGTFVVPRGLLSDFASEDIQAVHSIDRGVNKSGDYSFRLETHEIKVKTPQVRILKIEPQSVNVTLDELIVKKTEIKPQFIGDPAFGYNVKNDEIELNPNAVLVEGPKTLLEKLDAIKTERINLVGRTRSFRQTVSLDLPQNLKLIGEPLIDIYVPIQEESDEKFFENIAVRVMKPAVKQERIEVEPSAISFTLKGSKKQLEKIVPEKIFAYIDAGPLDAGEYDLPVEFFLPESVAIKGDAIKVKVRIKR
jgi:YbbR domain-containing protein